MCVSRKRQLSCACAKKDDGCIIRPDLEMIRETLDMGVSFIFLKIFSSEEEAYGDFAEHKGK